MNKDSKLQAYRFVSLLIDAMKPWLEHALEEMKKKPKNKPEYRKMLPKKQQRF